MALTENVPLISGKNKKYARVSASGNVNEVYRGSALMWDTALDTFVSAASATGKEKFGGISIENITTANVTIETLSYIELEAVTVAGTNPEAGMPVFLTTGNDDVYSDLSIDATDGLLVGFIKRPTGALFTVILDVLYASIDGITGGNDAAARYVATDTGTVNAYAIIMDPQTTLENGMRFTVLAPLFDNTADDAATLDVNDFGALGALNITGVLPGDIVTSSPMNIVYDGAGYVLLNPATMTTKKEDMSNILSIVDTGVAENTYVAVTDPAYPLDNDLMLTLLAPNHDNTGAATLTYNTDMDAILDGAGNALAAGAIVATCAAKLQFDGANWILLNSAIETTRKANEVILLTAASADLNDTYTAVVDPLPTMATTTGVVVYLSVDTANTGACSLNLNGGGAVNILVAGGGNPANDDIVTTCPAILYFDGTNFILCNPQS